MDIHAQVNLQKYVLLIGQRESHRVLATHGVTHGNNLTEVNKVPNFILQSTDNYYRNCVDKKEIKRAPGSRSKMCALRH